MVAKSGHILVQVNMDEKRELTIGGHTFLTGKRYSLNSREKNPVVALVMDGCPEIPAESYIICNYHYFDWSSPYHLYEDIFSVPVNEELFAIVNADGSLSPICGNLLVSRIDKTSVMELPPELKQQYWDRGKIEKCGNGYEPGQFIFWLPKSDYEIVYEWAGEERREIKIHESEITGIYKN